MISTGNESRFVIGGELDVARLGFGAMRLPGIRGPRDDAGAHTVLREAVRRGIDLIDTAHAYGPSEELVAEALHPYPDGLVIATKGGLGPDFLPDGRPERLRADCEESLRRLRLDTIDLWQLHEPDPAIPLEEQLGTVMELRDEGKIRFIGVSNVSATSCAGRASWSRWPPCRTASTSPSARRTTSSASARRRGSGSCRRADRDGGARNRVGRAHERRRTAWRDACPGGARLVAPPIADAAAHPRHRLGRAPARERRGRTARAVRGGASEAEGAADRGRRRRSG